MTWSDATRDKKYEELNEKVGRKTGETISVQPIVDAMDRNTARAKRVEDAVRTGQKQNQNKAPAPLPAAPPVGMERP